MKVIYQELGIVYYWVETTIINQEQGIAYLCVETALSILISLMTYLLFCSLVCSELVAVFWCAFARLQWREITESIGRRLFLPVAHIRSLLTDVR